MNRIVTALLCCAAMSSVAHAESVLIRNATVHTLAAAGTLKNGEVLIKDGVVAAVGSQLSADGARVIDAKGQPVTPGMFGGLTHLGIEEIAFEPTVDDYMLTAAGLRPEFDVMPAYNPASTFRNISLLGGITYAAVLPAADTGAAIIAGEGGVVRLDGSTKSHARVLYVNMGGDANDLSYGSRAGQYMLLKQAILETRTPNALLDGDQRLLTPAGRQVLRDFLDGKGLIVIDVDREADIRSVLAFAKENKLKIALAGAAEAWRAAADIASAQVPVFLDPLENLPDTFDSIGATLQNAAKLQKAGVKVGFTMPTAEPHNLSKLRQTAGNAVAHGLPWDAALAGLTRVPAEVLGIAGKVGTIEVGRRADLVVWDGDPLEVSTLTTHVFIDGVEQPNSSRQTALRDRYVPRVRGGTAR